MKPRTTIYIAFAKGHAQVERGRPLQRLVPCSKGNGESPCGKKQVEELLMFDRLALPCTLLFQIGLFLDTFTTAWIVNFVGINAEVNPFVRPFLGYFTIPWICINSLAMLIVPRY